MDKKKISNIIKGAAAAGAVYGGANVASGPDVVFAADFNELDAGADNEEITFTEEGTAAAETVETEAAASTAGEVTVNNEGTTEVTAQTPQLSPEDTAASQANAESSIDSAANAEETSENNLIKVFASGVMNTVQLGLEYNDYYDSGIAVEKTNKQNLKSDAESTSEAEEESESSAQSDKGKQAEVEEKSEENSMSDSESYAKEEAKLQSNENADSVVDKTYESMSESISIAESENEAKDSESVSREDSISESNSKSDSLSTSAADDESASNSKIDSESASATESQSLKNSQSMSESVSAYESELKTMEQASQTMDEIQTLSKEYTDVLDEIESASRVEVDSLLVEVTPEDFVIDNNSIKDTLKSQDNSKRIYENYYGSQYRGRTYKISSEDINLFCDGSFASAKEADDVCVCVIDNYYREIIEQSGDLLTADEQDSADVYKSEFDQDDLILVSTKDYEYTYKYTGNAAGYAGKTFVMSGVKITEDTELKDVYFKENVSASSLFYGDDIEKLYKEALKEIGVDDVATRSVDSAEGKMTAASAKVYKRNHSFSYVAETYYAETLYNCSGLHVIHGYGIFGTGSETKGDVKITEVDTSYRIDTDNVSVRIQKAYNTEEYRSSLKNKADSLSNKLDTAHSEFDSMEYDLIGTSGSFTIDSEYIKLFEASFDKKYNANRQSANDSMRGVNSISLSTSESESASTSINESISASTSASEGTSGETVISTSQSTSVVRSVSSSEAASGLESVSASGSISASASGSTIMSVADSVSVSNSTDRSESASTAKSESESVSASELESTEAVISNSESIQASESISLSTAGSQGISLSESLSTLGSVMSSELDSTSISMSTSYSTVGSLSVSNSESQSISASNAESASKSESGSTSDSISNSASISTSESISASEAARHTAHSNETSDDRVIPGIIPSDWTNPGAGGDGNAADTGIVTASGTITGNDTLTNSAAAASAKTGGFEDGTSGTTPLVVNIDNDAQTVLGAARTENAGRTVNGTKTSGDGAVLGASRDAKTGDPAAIAEAAGAAAGAGAAGGGFLFFGRRRKNGKNNKK